MSSETGSAAQTTLSGRLPTALKAGFGLGQVASQLFRDAPSLLLLFFLTSVMGIPPAIAGTAIFVPKVVFGALFDLGVGVASDRYAARFPRRRWLLVGGLAAPVAMVGPFAVPEAGTAIQVGWVFVTFSVYMAVYSIFSVPYLAQFSEMSSDPVERTELMGWKHTFTGLGVLMSSSLSPVLIGMFGGDQQAHLITMAVMGTVSMTCLLTSWRFSLRIPQPKSVGLPFELRDLPRAFADRRFAILCASAVVMTVSAGISYATMPFFVKFVLAQPNPLQTMGILTAIMAVAVMTTSSLWVLLSKQIGKKTTYIIAAVGHGIVTLAWVPAAGMPIWVAYILVALLAACNAGWGTIILAMLSDCIAAAREETGENRAGSYSAIWSIIEKAGIALGGTLVVGAILSAYGFDSVAAKAGHVQSASALAGIVMSYSIAPGIAKVIAAALIWLFIHEDDSLPDNTQGIAAHG